MYSMYSIYLYKCVHTCYMCICTFKGEFVVHGILSVVEELCAAPRFENDGKNGIIDF